MSSNSFVSPNDIRNQFTQAMSDMYQLEVPLYKKFLELSHSVNQEVLKKVPTLSENEARLLNLEHHGAIRVGTPAELSMMRRLFAVMGMYPVDYYDLSVAGIPVHSTAFRAVDSHSLSVSPFRIFCSLLRLDLIADNLLSQQAQTLLDKRQIFPEELLKQIDISEKQGGLSENQTSSFINAALDVFRWHENATVDKDIYDELKTAHGLVADVVSFKGPHINHLTPKILDIDACQNQFEQNHIKAKTIVEGPPKRKCPILLRQTSFIAIAEDIVFSDGERGLHSARFGEVEQRGVALTPKGRALYDQLLSQAKNGDSEIDYRIRLNQAFEQFPDSYVEMRTQELAYFHYSVNNLDVVANIQSNDIETFISEGLIDVKPIVYEDFLPVSAAGIFTSNLSTDHQQKSKTNIDKKTLQKQNTSRNNFEQALGTKVVNSFDLYEKLQQDSLDETLTVLASLE